MFGKKIQLVTHSGNFHADDVFACAALMLLVEKQGKRCRVIRTRDEQVIANADVVFDVGGVYDPSHQRFDHHQAGGAGTRSNGVPYAAAGLVWKAYGAEITGSQEIADVIERSMVTPIDALDNGVDLVDAKIEGVYPFSFQTIVNVFRPEWQEEKLNDDKQFMKVAMIMKDILARAIVAAGHKQQSRALIIESYESAKEKTIILLDKPFPRDEISSVLVEKPEPMFFVYPKSDKSGWKAEVVRKSMDTFEPRKAFPSAWAGKKDADLAELSGVADAQFCHNGRFLCTAASREGAIALAKRAIEV